MPIRGFDIIYTHKDGTPIEGRPDTKPSELPVGAKRLECLREWHAYWDRCQDAFNRAFSHHLSKALEEHRADRR